MTGKSVIIAEKPSVGREYAKALGVTGDGKNGYIENDKWICPWDRSRDYEYEEKHKCVISNNVKIIQAKEYKVYCDYCKNKFNDSHWYRKFKRHE